MLTIVECPCGNPKLHRKFRSEEKHASSRGFFSVAEGEKILNELEVLGEATAAEIAEARTALAECGLPAETVYTEYELLSFAVELLEAPEELREAGIKTVVDNGAISAAVVERLRGFLKDPEATYEAFMLEEAVGVLSHRPLAARESDIAKGLADKAITAEFAEKLRSRLKDVPYAPVDPFMGLIEALKAGGGNVMVVPLDRKGRKRKDN